MKISKAKKALITLARQKGISVEEVRKEIEITIDAGMANNNPSVQESWQKMSKDGKKPTPEEVVVYLAKQVKKKI